MKFLQQLVKIPKYESKTNPIQNNFNHIKPSTNYWVMIKMIIDHLYYNCNNKAEHFKPYKNKENVF